MKPPNAKQHLATLAKVGRCHDDRQAWPACADSKRLIIWSDADYCTDTKFGSRHLDRLARLHRIRRLTSDANAATATTRCGQACAVHRSVGSQCLVITRPPFDSCSCQPFAARDSAKEHSVPGQL